MSTEGGSAARTGREEAYGDPITRPFWEAAERRELWIQRCGGCGEHQFYPRLFCVACESDDVDWVAVRGTGTVYSATTVRVQIAPGFEPPYTVALVELDEGPRILTELVDDSGIGDRVVVRWRERPDAPPLPVFGASEDA